MLHWKVKADADCSEVLLEGDISEEANLDALRVTAPRIVLDVAKVRHINSEGLRRLIDRLRRMSAASVLEVKRCAPTFVDQLNLVPELGRLLKVRSIFVPLECPSCFGEVDVLVDVPEGANRPTLPHHNCKKCGVEMELSEPPDRYFAFMSE